MSRRPVFLMNVPATWETVAAQRLYVAEIKRLGRFLVGLGGTTPSRHDLAAVMRTSDTARLALRAARGYLPARQFSEAVARFSGGDGVGLNPNDPSSPRGVPLALVGGPLLAHHFGIFDRIEAAGGCVVLDATTSGERTLAAPFDRRALDDDPLLILADAYFGSIPDAFRRPNSHLYTWLRKEMTERGVRGIIFRRYIWCDLWHAESQRMKEWARVPLLDMEVGDEETLNGHEVSRIQSFLELLKCGTGILPVNF
jgi:hypothetical protein